jgi:signal recognition particle subunit SRP54
MFENLTDRLGSSLKSLAGQGSLTEDNIRDTLREVRKALLEADVALPVVKEFVEQVKEKALGQEVLQSLNPGQAFVKIVNDELVHTMGDANDALDLATKPPAIILMAGLQGAGKTTSVAKLARFLQEREKKKVMVVSADVYRPAAIEQLKTLAGEVETNFFPSTGDQDPVDIANAALEEARRRYMDVLIVDTAGRLHVDEDMMSEIKRLHGAISPVETLFVVDAMTGQDAANTAQAFNEALPLTGVILTKADGDSRGGAALSASAHRQADQIHRYGREDRRPGTIPPGSYRQPDSRHGRRALPGGRGRAQAGQEESRKNRQEVQERQGDGLRGSQGPVPADA